jgi:hypothetical protein
VSRLAPIRRRWFDVIGPAVLVVVPLLGFAFQGDERRGIYYDAERFGGNPARIAKQSYDEIGIFLNLGNFRPVGRFFDYLEHSTVFEVAKATGVPPHVVHGSVRIAMIALLAVVATQLVAALHRSAVAGASGHEWRDSGPGFAEAVFPLIVATVLVSAGPESPIVHFPFLFIGAAIVILGLPLLVASDGAMRRQQTTWRELALMASLGVVVAMAFDLVYIAPPLCLAMILARGVASKTTPGAIFRSAALRRFAALSVGFLAVFVPVRMEIAERCAEKACYSGSDIAANDSVPGFVGDRIITGTPVAGWTHVGDIASGVSAPAIGFADLLANSWLLLLIVTLVLLTARLLAVGVRAEADPPSVQRRFSAALAIIGTSTAVLAALLVSLAKLVQRERPPIGEGWRDTVIVQIGWAFVLLAALVLVASAIPVQPSNRKPIRVALTVVVIGLFASATMTLATNYRAADADRRLPLSNIVNQISTATVEFDRTETGNLRRCELIEGYTDFIPEPHLWIGGPQLWANLDALMLAEHGLRFCNKPTA